MGNVSFATRTEATRDDWMTPVELVTALGVFDLDPCANDDVPLRLAGNAFVKEQDGLNQSWFGRVWLNPPYGTDAKKWLKKLARHGNGIALIPPRMGSNWFHDIVLTGCDAILFVKGRIAFIDPNTLNPVRGNNADSILVAYGENNVNALEQSGIQGMIWRVKG